MCCRLGEVAAASAAAVHTRRAARRTHGCAGGCGGCVDYVVCVAWHGATSLATPLPPLLAAASSGRRLDADELVTVLLPLDGGGLLLAGGPHAMPPGKAP